VCPSLFVRSMFTLLMAWAVRYVSCGNAQLHQRVGKHSWKPLFYRGSIDAVPFWKYSCASQLHSSRCLHTKRICPSVWKLKSKVYVANTLGTISHPSSSKYSSESWELRPSLRRVPPSYVSSDLEDQCSFRGDEIRLAEYNSLFGRQPLNMPKQGKVRKGTHSCRECRRRKVKCILAFPTDVKCVPCQRRSSSCTSQSVFSSSTTTPESREYTGGLHDQMMRDTDDGRDVQPATPASALHGRAEVGEQYLPSAWPHLSYL
jgi:hypothetical protein